MHIPAAKAQELVSRILVAAGMPEENAQVQSEVLMEAELRGLASHGILRLPRLVERLRNGVADPQTKGVQTWRAEAFLDVDGKNGFGPVVANAALDPIVQRARRTGIAVAAIRNSGHLGAIGWYAERITKSGMVGIVLSTSEALVHPWGGRKAMIGTNPIAIGVPATPQPFIMDMATGEISMGKVQDHANRGEPLQEGWALNVDGEPTVDAEAALSGAIAPFGQAKGYALGLAFELLVASLTASAMGTDVKGTLDSHHPANKGDVLIAIEPNGGSAAALETYLNAIRNCPPLDGFDSVSVPGDRARQRRADNLEAGIVVPDLLWTRLQTIAAGYSLEI
ncbi:Ldh family oxidoreductase [Aureimonas fodinaquatilis]|uniref:Ldh family oxidoreductase n=1 Tax=Aureimonas fodinaquatilis TaxID=2565783 RepID=UPI001FE4D194|nr:Ldh family oxidoreductase [Aureimonas fodinaquatilis]